MNKTILRQLIKEVAEEVASMMKPNMKESAPPSFPRKLEKELLKRYKDNPAAAYATMWKIHNKKESGDKRISEMWTAWENKGMTEAGGTVSVLGVVDNDVFPHTSEELEEIAKGYGLQIRVIGDAAFGTENLKRYRIKFTGPSGQVDAFIDNVSQENGIEFNEVAPGENLNEQSSGRVTGTTTMPLRGLQHEEIEVEYSADIHTGTNSSDDPSSVDLVTLKSVKPLMVSDIATETEDDKKYVQMYQKVAKKLVPSTPDDVMFPKGLDILKLDDALKGFLTGDINDLGDKIFEKQGK